MPATITWTDPVTAAARAEQLGFPMEVLVAAIDVWTAAKNSGTPLHADNWPGTRAYHEALASLRFEGLQHDLVKETRGGVQFCLCSATKVAVIVAQGDARTCVDGPIKPRTKYARGAGFRTVLDVQGSLFATEAQTLAPFDVWLLLVHMTPTGETRAELSWPSSVATAISNSGKPRSTIIDWHERIFIGTSGPGPVISKAIKPGDLTPTADVDVPFRKRS